MLDEARELATTYNKRATEFTQRIKTFESQLLRLEFRVPTSLEFDAGLESYRLSFTSWDGTWGLYVVRKLPSSAWQRLGNLENCSVEVKVAAAIAFPGFLKNLIAAQRDALLEIDAAHTVLDAMAEKIGSFEEEGE